MNDLPEASPLKAYCSLPKVDLHRHLEGSLRFETVRQLARTQSMDLPATGQLRMMVQVNDGDPYTFENFLSKFSTLRLFYRSHEIIERITQEVIADAAADNVRYLELRFTPVALSRAQGYPLAQVMDWVTEGAQLAAQKYGVITRLIASVNRHESPSLAAQVSFLSAERREAGIVGLDLAGNEADFPAEPFIDVFQGARETGLHLTVHAGEWGSGENIAQAIRDFGAERIGHGIRVLDNPTATALALEHGTTFEVCPTSNLHSGAVRCAAEHPLPAMLARGLKVTLNSDDPGISQINLGDEYRLAVEKMGISPPGLHGLILVAASAAFLPLDEKQALINQLVQELSRV